MKSAFLRPLVGITLSAFLVSAIGCYPAYQNGQQDGQFGYQDAKGYDVGTTPVPPAGQPPRYGVDPGLAIAGVAAAGVLGYALGNNRGHRGGYYGPRHYRPYSYGRAYQRRGYYR